MVPEKQSNCSFSQVFTPIIKLTQVTDLQNIGLGTRKRSADNRPLLLQNPKNLRNPFSGRVRIAAARGSNWGLGNWFEEKQTQKQKELGVRKERWRWRPGQTLGAG